MSARAPILVGLVLISAIMALMWFVMGTSKDKYGESSTYVLYADFDDASGIRAKTRLQINGIDVGKIEDIEHVRSPDGRLRARVTLRLLKDFPVYRNAVVRKVAESLLGDYRLDLDPGTTDFAQIPPKGTIPNVYSKSDLEEIQTGLKRVTANVNQLTESFSRVLSGPEGEGSLKEILANVERSMVAIERTSSVLADMASSNNQVINKLIADLGQFSSSLAQTSSPGGDMKTLLENLARVSGRLEHIASSVDSMVSGDEGASDERGQLRTTLASLNDSIDRLNSIARKVDEGQGTLGRVVNDPVLINKVESTLDSAGQLIGGLSRMETQIELRTQYEVPFDSQSKVLDPAVKNILGLRIVPRPDKYYLLEAISDPRGTSSHKIITKTLDGTTTTVTDRSEISFDTLKFSAQFAKRYYFLTLRFGIIENTGGFGADLFALRDRLELRLDAFDFTRRDQNVARNINPRFRSTAMFGLFDHVAVQAGIDDPFNASLRTWFAGGVLRFTDDDLKALMTVGAVPKP
jgi:phospholipid/cholesterol/gamma-HCH transport system substrate-binding protein